MIRRLLNRFTKKLPYEDRFILRLPSSTIGTGMLHEGNPYLMNYAIKNMPEGKYILEIGSWDGAPFGSAHFIQEIKKNPDFRVLDKNPNYLIQKLV